MVMTNQNYRIGKLLYLVSQAGQEFWKLACIIIVELRNMLTVEAEYGG